MYTLLERLQEPGDREKGGGREGGLTFDKMISGARYSGVPHRVHVRPFTFLAKPKSVTLM